MAKPESRAPYAPHNLPVALTPLVDRERERALLGSLLRDPDCRLITLGGVGGMGKTRLALEAGYLAVKANPPITDGVYLVELAAVAPGPSAEITLASAIANTLGLTLSGPEPTPAQVSTYLQPRRMLLLLDNFEHLHAGSVFLAELLRVAPDLKILVTSRERLRLRGETVVLLDGLPYPDGAAGDLAAYPAVQLFVQSARAHTESFALTSENAPQVARICGLVEGSPLGIELAASWTRLLSCAEIAAEIARSLDFLADTQPDLPARQQSLRAVFDYSWDLLGPRERRTLRQLAVFQGDFSLEAAVAVLDEPLPMVREALARLIDCSLLRRVEADGRSRFEMLEVVRQYGAEQLERAAERPAITARHAAYYTGWLATRTAALRGADQQLALSEIGSSIDQVRAAWQSAVDRADYLAIERAAPAMFHFYDMRSWFREGAAAFGAARAALAGPPDPAAALALAMATWREGWFVFHDGRQRAAQALLAESAAALRALDARAELSFVLNYQAAVCAYLGDHEATVRLAAEGLALAEALPDPYIQAVASNILGQSAYERGDYAAAQRYAQHSLALEQQIGNSWSMAFSLLNLGKVAYVTSSYVEARWFFEESLRIRTQIDDLRGAAICYGRLGDTALAAGDFDEAAGLYDQSLRLFQSIGNRSGITTALINLGRLALARRQPAGALTSLQSALRLALETSSQPQVAAILRLVEPLLADAGRPELAAEVRRLLASPPPDIEGYGDCAKVLMAVAPAALRPSARPMIEQVIGATPPPPASTAAGVRSRYPRGLTAREVEVLRLVAQGLTDAEVADRLILSKRTVSTHLSAIYNKLDVTTRTAAARFAIEQGLV